MKRHKNSTLLIFTALTIVIATVIVVSRGQKSLASPNKADATPIQEGVMTETQRRHSKLYENGRTRKLRDLPNPVEVQVTTPWGESADAPKTFEESLSVSVCSADAVVVVAVKNNSSQLTSDGTFVFTDSEVTAEEILKNNPNARIQAHDVIVLTRPGGAVETNGRIIRVTDKAFKPLQVDNKYLIFLRFITATGAYQQLSSQSAFELRDNRVNKLTDEEFPYPFNDETNPIALVTQVRAKAINCENDLKRK